MENNEQSALNFIEEYQCAHMTLTQKFVQYAKEVNQPLREELIDRLSDLYAENMQCVGLVCDRVLDRSGALLGEVRKQYAEKQQYKQKGVIE